MNLQIYVSLPKKQPLLQVNPHDHDLDADLGDAEQKLVSVCMYESRLQCPSLLRHLNKALCLAV